MSAIDVLLARYSRDVGLFWDRNLAAPERVWFVHYEAEQERRMRLRLADFETATKNAGRGWIAVDLTDEFARWMGSHEYRDAYFQDPDAMDLALAEFEGSVIDRVRGILSGPEADENTVVAIHGVLSLFGLMRTSKLVESVAPSARGLLLVFFPGERDGSNFRFLGVRDGWNYRAYSITADGE
jgi:hypothetical protein